MFPLLAVLLTLPATDPFAGIEQLRIVRYDVRGDDWAAIGRSIAAHGMGQAGGVEVAARTRWQVRWHATSQVSGESCRIVGAMLDTSITVTLPQLRDEERLDPALRRRWSAYLDGLRMHEAGHARYAYQHIEDVRRAVLASDCAHVVRDGQAAIDAINRWETHYDRITRHGSAQSEAPPVD